MTAEPTPYLTDGQRLGIRFESLKRDKGISKALFARKYKVPGGASMISQHISDHRPISLEAASAYVKGFGCTLADISPALASKLPPDQADRTPQSIHFVQDKNMAEIGAGSKSWASNVVSIAREPKAESVLGKALSQLFDALPNDDVLRTVVFGKAANLILEAGRQARESAQDAAPGPAQSPEKQHEEHLEDPVFQRNAAMALAGLRGK